MIKKGNVYIKRKLAGWVWEDENGFHFRYDEKYLKKPLYGEVSITLPLTAETYSDKNILPFFDGLIPEGWLLDVAVKNWKLNQRDRMELLLTVCKDCIGAVSIKRAKE